jgi:hypothetical protein
MIGPVVNSFLQDASEATGFSFTLIGGGLDKVGNIKMCLYVVHSLFLFYHLNINDRSSVGKIARGKTFMTSHKDWEEGVNNPFKEFLRLKHRKLCNFFGLNTILS